MSDRITKTEELLIQIALVVKEIYSSMLRIEHVMTGIQLLPANELPESQALERTKEIFPKKKEAYLGMPVTKEESRELPAQMLKESREKAPEKKSEPATQKQVDYLKRLGEKLKKPAIPTDLSKKEASVLIEAWKMEDEKK